VYTREAFERQRAAAKQVERRESRILAGAAVGLGLAQLVLIRWADAHLVRRPRLALEGGVFLAYMALVGWLFWRMFVRVRAARPVCPRCGAALEGMSERVAAATGHCDSCGAQVVEGVSSPP
jgi:hypothetical protein